jgi:hypothetical protein
MEQKNNPTGQLLELIRVACTQDQNHLVMQVVATIFEVDVKDSKAVAESVLRLLQLCADARSATEKFIDGDISIFLAPITRLEEAFGSVHLGGPWQTVRQKIDQSLMEGLKFGDHSLGLKFMASSTDNPLQVKDFLAKLEILLEECLSSGLPSELQKLFLRHLEALRAALLDYRVNGPEALERALDEVVGSMARHKETVESAFETCNEFIPKFFDALGKMNDFVSMGQNIFLLGTSAAPFLLGAIGTP